MTDVQRLTQGYKNELVPAESGLYMFHKDHVAITNMLREQLEREKAFTNKLFDALDIALRK